LTAAGQRLAGQGKKILVVDDEAYNTEVLEAVLVSLGVPAEQIVTCLSGKDGLELLQNSIHEDESFPTTEFTVIFTDLSMPMMDGYRFSRKSRSLLKKKKINKED